MTRTPFVALAVVLLALALGGWAGEGSHHDSALHSAGDTHPSAGETHAAQASESGHGLHGTCDGPSCPVLNEPHCHTVGFGYPSPPHSALAETAGESGGTSPGKFSTPLLLAVVDDSAQWFVAPPAKPPSREWFERDFKSPAHLSTTRLLL